MKFLGMLLGIIVVAAAAAVWYAVKCYNRFVNARNRVEDQEAQVHVQLKRRCDLVPNLTETVKGCAGFEKGTLEAVMEARNKILPGDREEAEAKLGHALGRLFAVSESYPELKTSANFLELQKQLQEIEDKIAKARQFCNDTILKYNTEIQVFPANLVAEAAGFRKKEFLRIPDEEKQPVKVTF